MKLYTRTVCGQCSMAKTVMEAKGIKYDLVNVDEDESARAHLKELGYQTAPVLEVDGEYFTMPQLIGKVHMLSE